MIVACVAIPHFALRVAVLERPELDGAPLVLGAAPTARPLVLDASPEAAARGIRAGIGIREVAALCPDAVVLSPHPVREHQISDEITMALGMLSPLVEPDGGIPGFWYVDLTGSDRLLGPPTIAAATLLEAMPPLLRPRVGVSRGKFPARVAAARSQAGASQIIEEAQTEAFLAHAPTSLLPVSPELLRRMERLGLRTLGDLAALPATAVQARFGKDGRRLHDLARGIDPSPVIAQPLPEVVRESMTFSTPATSVDRLQVALERLALRAFSRPMLRDRHVRQARLRAMLEGGGSWEQSSTLRDPGGRQRVVEVLGYRLTTIGLPGPVERLTLELVAPIAVGGRQELLPGFRSRRPRELVEAARWLEQRYGHSGLYHVMEIEPWSRIPERRQALIAFEP